LETLVTETPSSATSRSIANYRYFEGTPAEVQGAAEEMGFQVLHGIVDCLWDIGEPISKFKEAVERETRILTDVDPTTESPSCP
jgi:hypothetical protein